MVISSYNIHFRLMNKRYKNLDMEFESPNYFAIIPTIIRYDKGLSNNEKLLYGEITALCVKYGYCWTENGYFSKLYNAPKRKVNKWIMNLCKKEYIRLEFIEEENSKKQRKILLINYKYYLCNR